MISNLIINIRFKVFFFLIIFSLSSCITNRNLEYVRDREETFTDNIYINDYRLQKGDLLSVQISTTTKQQHDFFNKEQVANSQLMTQNPYLYGYLIKDDGTLNLPSLGVVNAAGFTVEELEKIIENIATSYFESPVVKLNIINFEVTILGEVNNPGSFKIIDPNVNILYAISLAGDITQYGNRHKVKIIRNKNNFNKVFYIDLTNISILNDKKFLLQPNDIIYVAPLKKKFYAFNNIGNIISISLSAVTLFLLINQK